MVDYDKLDMHSAEAIEAFDRIGLIQEEFVEKLALKDVQTVENFIRLEYIEGGGKYADRLEFYYAMQLYPEGAWGRDSLPDRVEILLKGTNGECHLLAEAYVAYSFDWDDMNWCIVQETDSLRTMHCTCDLEEAVQIIDRLIEDE